MTYLRRKIILVDILLHKGINDDNVLQFKCDKNEVDRDNLQGYLKIINTPFVNGTLQSIHNKDVIHIKAVRPASQQSLATPSLNFNGRKFDPPLL